MILTSDFNHGLGFQPVSLFVSFEKDEDYPLKRLQDYFDQIAEKSIKDLIFHGDLINNQDFLKWLTTILIVEDYTITATFDFYEFAKAPNLTMCANRFVLRIKALFPRWTEVLSRLDAEDIILFEMESVTALGAVTRAIKSNKSNLKLMFDTCKLSEATVLDGNIFTAYPFS